MGDRAHRQVDVLRAITRGPGVLAAHRWPRERLERHRDERLRGLLRHAREAAPFHAESLRGLDLDAPVRPAFVSAPACVVVSTSVSRARFGGARELIADDILQSFVLSLL